MTVRILDLGPRELRVEPANKVESAIESRFPRIAREVMVRWPGPEIDAYLDSLLIDTRGNRMGFPPDVLEEIMFLAGIRWYLTKVETPDTLESPRDEFSFGLDEFRRCGTTGSWLLI